jgi:crossover junction endodeoxyribonuclease RuvC
MRILGVDPGSRLTGFGVVALDAGRMTYVASGCVRVPAGELPERLKVIYDGLAQVIAEYRPTVLSIEKVFVAHNVDSALKLGQARGAAICAAVNHALSVTEYTALQIKQAIVGVGHARKEQVQHMVKALLKLSGSPQADAADALACALCHAHHAQGLAAFASKSGLRVRASARRGLR